MCCFVLSFAFLNIIELITVFLYWSVATLPSPNHSAALVAHISFKFYVTSEHILSLAQSM